MDAVWNAGPSSVEAVHRAVSRKRSLKEVTVRTLPRRYVVTQRTREIGIRMALGARPSAVLGLVLRRGGALAVEGIIVGTLGALAVTRVLTTLLYEVRPDDSGTYVTIGCGLLAVALAASYIPARRAAAVDPSSALRGD